MRVSRGSRVIVAYEGRLKDGTVFDSTGQTGKHLEFVVGDGNVLPGVERAVLHMRKGEQKTVQLRPLMAFGQRNPSLVRSFPIEKFAELDDLKAGMRIVFNLDSKTHATARVHRIRETEVVLDLNHPLAGEVVEFSLKVLSVQRRA